MSYLATSTHRTHRIATLVEARSAANWLTIQDYIGVQCRRGAGREAFARSPNRRESSPRDRQHCGEQGCVLALEIRAELLQMSVILCASSNGMSGAFAHLCHVSRQTKSRIQPKPTASLAMKRSSLCHGRARSLEAQVFLRVERVRNAVAWQRCCRQTSTQTSFACSSREDPAMSQRKPWTFHAQVRRNQGSAVIAMQTRARRNAVHRTYR